MKIGIIGSGSWGLALSVVLSQKYNVYAWVRRKEILDYIIEHRKSPDYLKDIHLPENINFTNKPEDLKNTEIVLVVVPSKFFREVVKNFKNVISGKVIISCTKGIETESLKTPYEILRDEIKEGTFGVLSGPSHAEEVAKKLPCAVTVAFEDISISKEIQNILSTEYFRVYAWDDVKGVEIAGASKNVIAIAAGISDGLGLGDNAKASLITRAMFEISKLGEAVGGKRETFFGLSGIGDLVVTCTSKHSRNRYFGEMLSKGQKPDQILASMKMIPEGYFNALSIKKLSEELNIETPICLEVYNIIYQAKSPIESMKNLMQRSLKTEFY